MLLLTEILFPSILTFYRSDWQNTAIKSLCYFLWVYFTFGRLVNDSGLIGSKKHINFYIAATLSAIMDRVNYSFIDEANTLAACNKTLCNEINNS